MGEHFTLELADEAATLFAGQQFALKLKPGMVVYMHGDLGAGKTTFVRGVLQGFGYQGKVKSPTYTLVEPYDLTQQVIYHFDLYRFTDPYEWDAAGFNEYFSRASICLIEWPEKAGNILPKPNFDVHLDMLGEGRKLTIMQYRMD